MQADGDIMIRGKKKRMKITEILTEDWRKVKYDFHREPDNWFVATADGKEIGRFQGKSQFDSSAAQEAAKKCINKHRSDAAAAHMAAADNAAQFEKPLSEIEKRWIMLYKKLYVDNVHGEEKDYNNLSRWGEAVRKSIRAANHPEEHPLVKEFLNGLSELTGEKM